MTLSEFLLTRIGEDEAVAREVEAEDTRVQYVIDYEYDEGPDDSFWADYDGARPSVSVGAARVLAECEAKRRIVAEHSPTDPCDAHNAAFETIPCDTLRFLALPYASHPDYRDEWRP